MPPLRVIRPPPSIVVSVVMVCTAVGVMVCGAGPQLNVTVPPPLRAVVSAAAVQLAGVPLPTTPAACNGRAPTKTHPQVISPINPIHRIIRLLVNAIDCLPFVA
ncbi:MAG: hypothetical protein IPH82_30070 [Chloroflexi bacterium]|nr:hypothetical protein [Chloroflexota bacterium]